MRLLSRLSPRARKIFDWILGLTLIVLGILGLFLPILQGVALIVLGLAVLSSHNRHAKALYDRFKRVGQSVRERVAHHRDRAVQQRQRRRETRRERKRIRSGTGREEPSSPPSEPPQV